MTFLRLRHAPTAALLLAGIAAFAAEGPRVTVAPPEQDCRVRIVAIDLPAGAPKSAALRDASGHLYPLQSAGDHRAQFLIPAQRAGQTLRFDFVPAEPGRTADVTVTRARADLGLEVGGRRTLVYQTDEEVLPRADIDPLYRRAGYLHPILSPAGVVVTGDYPANHPHHHGIWTSWSRVRFQGRDTNFWETAQRRGTTDFAGMERAWNGPVSGGFVSRHRLVDLAGGARTAALDETWEVALYHVTAPPAAARVFDLLIRQACATPETVLLPRHPYGGLGVRGRDEWNGSGMLVLTSEGAATREEANTSRVRWCYLGGPTPSGGVAGLAVLSHPGNARFPEPIRVHPAMPFLSVAPVQTGDLAITPDQPFVARYRIVVFDGPPDSAALEAYWHGFALMPVASVDAPN